MEVKFAALLMFLGNRVAYGELRWGQVAHAHLHRPVARVVV